MDQRVLVATTHSRMVVDGPNRLALQGDLGFSNVAELAGGIAPFLALCDPQHPVLNVDLIGVEHSDSAGVAMLVEMLRLSQHDGYRLQLHNVPEQMRAIIRVSALDEVLPVTMQGDEV